MGQFSWLATDTGESIKNDQHKGYQKVKMVYKDQKGVQQIAEEDEYEGYGEFGGIDFYEAIVWMNPWYKGGGKNERYRLVLRERTHTSTSRIPTVVCR